MAKPKAKERILETALAMFNRFGEPNVSTNAIAADLGMSPGNLHYHFASKDALTLALFERFEAGLLPLLAAAAEVRHVEDAWLCVHMLFERIWHHRFLYRNLNDLLSKSRALEQRLQALINAKGQSMSLLLAGLQHGGALQVEAREAGAAATTMVLLLNYWLSFEYVRDPRHALEDEAAAAALRRGAFQTLSVLLPWLKPAQKAHLMALSAQYDG
jgi:AcrR family transcriptional regulator